MSKPGEVGYVEPASSKKEETLLEQGQSKAKSSCAAWLADPTWRFAYCVAVLVLLVLILGVLCHWSVVAFLTKEKMQADPGFQSGAQPGSFDDSGGRMRLMSEPSSTTQGWRETGFNPATGAIGTQQLPISMNEGLVNNRGEPDFWEISSELDAYRRGVGKEFKKEGSTEFTVPENTTAAPSAPVESFIAAQWSSPTHGNMNASDRALSVAGFGY